MDQSKAKPGETQNTAEDPAIPVHLRHLDYCEMGGSGFCAELDEPAVIEECSEAICTLYPGYGEDMEIAEDICETATKDGKVIITSGTVTFHLSEIIRAFGAETVRKGLAEFETAERLVPSVKAKKPIWHYYTMGIACVDVHSDVFEWAKDNLPTYDIHSENELHTSPEYVMDDLETYQADWEPLTDDQQMLVDTLEYLNTLDSIGYVIIST